MGGVALCKDAPRRHRRVAVVALGGRGALERLDKDRRKVADAHAAVGAVRRALEAYAAHPDRAVGRVARGLATAPRSR